MTRKSLFARRLLASALVLGASLALTPGRAGAQTLEQALAQAYQTNPTLAAERARLRAVDEAVPQALSGYRPSAQITLGATRSGTETKGSSGYRVGTEGTSKSIGASVSQPLFDGTVTPGVKRAESLVQAERATLVATEQDVLLNAAIAYLNVVQNQAVLALTINNEQVLRRQLDASRDRFRVGEYTRTDVAQSESRLAGAIASRIQAEGELQASRAVYERMVGARPGDLKAPRPRFKLPANLDELVEMARANNPSVLAASFSENAQRNAVDQQYGRLLPSANLTASATRTYDPTSSSTSVRLDRSDSLQIGAQVTIPIYQAGLPESLVREAKQTANQLRIQIDETRRQVTESAISAWQSLQTARANVESYQSQINASQIALEGVRQEAQVGSRTVLDVLDQEQELLNARVNLVRAQRNEQVAAFTVLSAMGQLTARQLALPVDQYDPGANYTRVRDKWVGTGVGE